MVTNKAKMQYIISLAIFSVITDLSWSQTTQGAQTPVTPSSIIKTTQKDESISRSAIDNANLKDLWVHKPITHEAQAASEHNSRLMEFRAPHSITKLTKTPYGYEPYFSKGYFEPFERRPKVVTLVGFRKNGLIPKRTVKHSAENHLEVAELQSPFNGISNFWMDAVDNLA